ncbi:MAG: hypothetical protein [Circular genetic element sp.]|nr:MAG: hypothetical protein [Circular genetic element sp.]
MARQFAQPKTKIQPAVQTIRFEVPSGASAKFIDLSAAASIVNRRFYRQGLNWAVAGITMIAAPSASGTVKFSKLPNTWVTSNAWEKAFRMWKRQQDEALEGQESIKGRFNDFKIFADSDMATGVAPYHLVPIDLTGTPYNVAGREWNYSQVVLPNDAGVPGATTERTLHMVGGNITGVTASLTKAYKDSRATPQSPDPATPGSASVGLFTDMFNVGLDDSEIVANAEFRNNDLPYNQDQYPGGPSNAGTCELIDEIFLNPASTVPGKYHMQGSNIPCGLIRIDSGASTNITVILHLMPGDHRGYLTEKMQEM